jgi:hypothetical protein
MTRFVATAIVLLVVPMVLLNPLGRPAFLGYYLGVLTLWLAFVIASRSQAMSGADRRDAAAG